MLQIHLLSRAGLVLPPVNSSPFPSKIYLPKFNSLAKATSEGSHTIAALNFVNSPSLIIGYFKYKNLDTVSSSTASPKNSSLSLSS